MVKLEFDKVESNLAGHVWRARVPGGWLVRVTNDVRGPVNYGEAVPRYEEGYKWRDSICFVPDPNHEWGKEPTEAEIQEALKMADRFYGREQ